MFGWLKAKPRGPHRAHFDLQGVSIEVAAEQTLLQAALAANLPYPHDCRVGSCKTCICHLVEGKVRQLTDTSYVLDASERQAGAILACQTRLLGDVRIRVRWQEKMQVDPGIDGTVQSVRHLTADIVELTIRLDAPMTYTAGQHARISVPALGIGRRYSFARAPEAAPQTLLCFYVRLVPDGAFSRWVQTAIGQPVQVHGPMGGFSLVPTPAPLLFVAGGSGLAPIKAMLEQAAREGCGRAVTFLFGARTASDLYVLHDLEAIAASWPGRFDFVPVLSHEPAGSGWSGERGMVTDGLPTRVRALGGCDAYLCGPPPMVESATAALRACGVAAESIRADRFEINGEHHAPERLAAT